MSAFIGYWGCGDAQMLEQQLARIIVNQSPTSQFNHSFDNSSARLGFAHWGRHVRAQFKEDQLSAVMAASALRQDEDVVVRANRDGLWVRRESFGRCTIYWTKRNEIVWFASHFQLLLPLLDTSAISNAGLYGYACFSFVPAPYTPLQSVFAVPAGAIGKFILGEKVVGDELLPRIELSWTLQNDDWQEAMVQLRNESEARTQLQELLISATLKQLADQPSDPVGVFLSGGLDSSVVAAFLVRAGVKVRAYTLDFGEHGGSELPHAERVAGYLNIPLVKVKASPPHIKQALSATAEALDLPFGDGVTVPLYLLNQAAAEECSIVFNGEGGDQLFAGWTNKPLIASDVYQQVHPEGNDFQQEYLRTFHRLHGYEAQVFTAAQQAEIKQLDPLNWLSDALDDIFTPSLLHRLRRANLMLKGAQNIQPRATNLALAHGLAVRSPFCDPAMARWTFQVANNLFLRESHEKYLLKKAVELWLPPDIVWREKRGMGVPLTQWCLGPLWREVGTWLQPSVLREEGIWQEDLALRLSTGNLSGQLQGRRIGETLWLLVMWQVWRKAVLQDNFKQSLVQPFWLPPKFWHWRFKHK